MFERLEAIKVRYEQLTEELSKPEVLGDYNQLKKLSKEQKDLEVKVVAEAIFIMEDDNEELVGDIIKINTLAIMFPFIRSQVSLLTTQPGMTPVVLPPINTTKFID